MSDAAWLILEDGTTFTGQVRVWGQSLEGEVIFNTALTGYQEILTDPSYAGQLVALTYPLVGNYGTAPAWTESIRPAARGLLVHQCLSPSHGDAVWSLEEYCQRYRLTLMTEVDTRALTRHLRQFGTRRGAILPASGRHEEGLARAQRVNLAGIVDSVSTPMAYEIPGSGAHVVVVDYGVKQGILDNLARRGFRLTVLPASAGADDLERLRPDGVVLSNGPGDPTDLTPRLDLVRWATQQYPTLGICLGHQLVAMALGGRTYPLKFGHHGSNHPVLDLKNGQVQITSHNHGYAVSAESLPEDLAPRFVNLHDQTVEGLCHRRRPVLTVQHHPEAGPGPHDADFIFDEFQAWVEGGGTGA